MSRSMKATYALLFGLCVSLLLPLQAAQAHCQIPCGIFDDNARVKSMLEDVVTIEKSIKLMNELAGKSDVQSQNQFVRWIMNKEHHADRIISVISEYFLAQRVKSSQKNYNERLVKHHAVMVAAMKAKQGSDKSVTETLKKNIEALLTYYPEHKH